MGEGLNWRECNEDYYKMRAIMQEGCLKLYKIAQEGATEEGAKELLEEESDEEDGDFMESDEDESQEQTMDTGNVKVEDVDTQVNTQTEGEKARSGDTLGEGGEMGRENSAKRKREPEDVNQPGDQASVNVKRIKLEEEGGNVSGEKELDTGDAGEVCRYCTARAR